MKDNHSRSVVKAITWRIIATVTTMLLVYIFTRELILTLGVGAFDVGLKLIFYYLHEQVWNAVKWGKKEC